MDTHRDPVRLMPQPVSQLKNSASPEKLRGPQNPIFQCCIVSVSWMPMDRRGQRDPKVGPGNGRIHGRHIPGMNADCFSFLVEGSHFFTQLPARLAILEDLVGDSWWGRAWIYQEEYLSGLRMDLLIPVKPCVQVPGCYGEIAGEFCAQATRFREQATIFLLAYLATGWKQYHASCCAMLPKIEKYSITLKRSNAIIANACEYRTRLNSPSLVDEGRSLSLCLLAQFLLNGEVVACGVTPNRADRNLLQHNIDGVLHQVQPVMEDLPIQSKGLTFLKFCRLPPVEFVPRGMQTVGYIWYLPKHTTARTIGFNLPRLSNARRIHLTTHPWKSFELETLSHELKQRQEHILAAKLFTYLKKRRNDITSPALDYMDLMASKLFQAIDSGLQLRLASLPGRCASGVFIRRKWELSQSMHVLTTWQPPQEASSQAGNAVSLKISLSARNFVTPVRWINGMVFFSGNEYENIIMSWPLSWTKRLG